MGNLVYGNTSVSCTEFHVNAERIPYINRLNNSGVVVNHVTAWLWDHKANVLCSYIIVDDVDDLIALCRVDNCVVRVTVCDDNESR